MLSQEILTALRNYTATLHQPVTLAVQTGEHPRRAELLAFLRQFASVSARIDVVERDAGLRSPISFAIERAGEPSGIVFSGIPGGHEFNSLVLAVLRAGGVPPKLDAGVRALVEGIATPLAFEIYVSLSCHNCPDVVQTLQQFALLNPLIRAEMIDGGEFQDLIERNGIQGVPTVMLNGAVFLNGKVDTARIVEKLLATQPGIGRTDKANAPVTRTDVTVIGGGPAGSAAAIYAARKGVSVTVIADRIGGQVKDTMGIENLISVPKTTGPELSNALLAHMNDYAITIREGLRVERIEPGEFKRVHLNTGEVIESRTVIIATGAKWRELGVPGEKELIGRGVAYCPHCDGPFFKGKDVVVVGGGNSGIEAALDLAGIAKSVTVLEFAPALKADQVLIAQMEKRPNISVVCNAATERVVERDGKVAGIAYTERATGQGVTLATDGIFVQIGLVPNSQFVDGLVERTPRGEIVIDAMGQTSTEGIFACGDVTTVPYKQIIVAAGEGAKASLSAFDYLLKQAA